MHLFRSHQRILVALALGAALVVGLAGGAIAAATVRNGKAVKAVSVVAASDTAWATTTTTDVPNMSVTMSVPANQKGLFVATFSASANGPCDVSMTISGPNGGDMPPGNGWFHSDPNNSDWNSAQFIAGPYPSGTYTLKVRFSTTSVNACYLAQRTLAVERSLV
jgi:hypothetical protein